MYAVCISAPHTAVAVAALIPWPWSFHSCSPALGPLEPVHTDHRSKHVRSLYIYCPTNHTANNCSQLVACCDADKQQLQYIYVNIYNYNARAHSQFYCTRCKIYDMLSVAGKTRMYNIHKEKLTIKLCKFIMTLTGTYTNSLLLTNFSSKTAAWKHTAKSRDKAIVSATFSNGLSILASHIAWYKKWQQTCRKAQTAVTHLPHRS